MQGEIHTCTPCMNVCEVVWGSHVCICILTDRRKTWLQNQDPVLPPSPAPTPTPRPRPQTLFLGPPTDENRESPCLTIWDSGFCWNLPPLLPDTNSLWNKGDRGLDYLHSQHQASCGLFKFFFIRLGNSMATTQAARKPPRLKLPTSNMATWLSES